MPPDRWAIKQLFPVMPIHRLEKPPTNHAVLGDMHNLFGDTHAVHVKLDSQGGVVFDAAIKNDSVRENRMTYKESGRLLKFYEEGLGGYTYLEQGLGARR